MVIVVEKVALVFAVCQSEVVDSSGPVCVVEDVTSPQDLDRLVKEVGIDVVLVRQGQT